MVGGHRFIRSVVLGAPLRYFKDLGGGGGGDGGPKEVIIILIISKFIEHLFQH